MIVERVAAGTSGAYHVSHGHAVLIKGAPEPAPRSLTGSAGILPAIYAAAAASSQQSELHRRARDRRKHATRQYLLID